MTGSHPFSIEDSENFKRSFKKLAKTHGAGFVELVAEVLEDLTMGQSSNRSTYGWMGKMVTHSSIGKAKEAQRKADGITLVKEN